MDRAIVWVRNAALLFLAVMAYLFFAAPGSPLLVLAVMGFSACFFAVFVLRVFRWLDGQ
jgi:Na+/proline symporter